MEQVSNLRAKLKLKDLKTQLSSVWANMPDELKVILTPKIEAAHNNVFNGPKNRSSAAGMERVHYELGMVRSLINGEHDDLLKHYDQPCPEGIPDITPSVDSEGVCYWTGAWYDGTDPFWAYTLIALIKTLGQRPNFNNKGQVIKIPDDATIAVLSDWGGGNYAANLVATKASISAPPETSYYVHLGDVYYAGTNSDLLPFEDAFFLQPWPGKSGLSFALNSNHDMYAQATGYFNTTLASPTFGAQNSTSFFALYNSQYRIVGLDTAYFAELLNLYNDGCLIDPDQTKFLQDQAGQASLSGQTLILMTHHNGLSLDGKTNTSLWNQVVNQLSALSGLNVYWYWGHEHAAAVYKPQTTSNINIFPRVCGHGCVPWGIATDLSNNPQTVQWFEQGGISVPNQNYFVNNGYVTLQFNGTSAMTETFYDQNGNVSWSNDPSQVKGS